MLKQAKHEVRALFLKLFIRELILNSLSKEDRERFRERTLVRKERKMRPVPVELVSSRPGKLVLNVVQAPRFPQQLSAPSAAQMSMQKSAVKAHPQTSPTDLSHFQPSILHVSEAGRGEQITQTTSTKQKSSLMPSQIPPMQKSIQPVQKPASSSSPSIKQRGPAQSPVSPISNGEGFKKISAILADRAVVRIECPGPNKNLIINKFGQTTLANIRLSQEEINSAINYFSEKARIPIIEGIFKANVGNLIISAVISEFVGSRFIIEKLNSRSLIERQYQQLSQAQYRHKK